MSTVVNDNPAIETINVDESDLKTYLLKHEPVTYIFKDEAEVEAQTRILPTVPEISIRYDLGTEFASFKADTGEILVGDNFLGYGEGAQTAMLRHEKAHAVFGNLPARDQAELIFLVSVDEWLMQKWYGVMRKGYQCEYFSPQKLARIKERTGDLYYKTSETMLLWEGDELVEVSLPILINELLAYSVTPSSGGEAFSGSEDVQESFRVAKEIVNGLDPESYRFLESLGFLQIEGEDLLAQFRQSEGYQEAIRNLGDE